MLHNKIHMFNCRSNNQALITAKTIDSAYRKYLAFGDIANKHAKAGEFDQALETVKIIDNAYCKAKALANIAGTYAETGRKEQSAQILSQALGAVGTIKNASSKAEVLAKIVSTYTEAEQQPSKSDMAKFFDIVQEIHPIGLVFK